RGSEGWLVEGGPKSVATESVETGRRTSSRKGWLRVRKRDFRRQSSRRGATTTSTGMPRSSSTTRWTSGGSTGRTMPRDGSDPPKAPHLRRRRTGEYSYKIH